MGRIARYRFAAETIHAVRQRMTKLYPDMKDPSWFRRWAWKFGYQKQRRWELETEFHIALLHELSRVQDNRLERIVGEIWDLNDLERGIVADLITHKIKSDKLSLSLNPSDQDKNVWAITKHMEYAGRVV